MRCRMFAPILPRPTRPMCMPSASSRVRVRACPAHSAAADACVRRSSVSRQLAKRIGHQQVAVLGLVLALERLLAGELHRLVRVRERQPHERGAQRAEAVEQELRVERDRDLVADERRLERLGGLRVVALAGVEHDLALGERQPDRGVPLGDERHALGGVREGVRADDGVDRRLVREQPAHGRVVAVDEQARGLAAGGLEADQVDAGAGGQRDGDRPGAAERLRGVGQRASPDQRDGRDVRATPASTSARAARAGSGRSPGA